MNVGKVCYSYCCGNDVLSFYKSSNIYSIEDDVYEFDICGEKCKIKEKDFPQFLEDIRKFYEMTKSEGDE